MKRYYNISLGEVGGAVLGRFQRAEPHEYGLGVCNLQCIHGSGCEALISLVAGRYRYMK